MALACVIYCEPLFAEVLEESLDLRDDFSDGRYVVALVLEVAIW